MQKCYSVTCDQYHYKYYETSDKTANQLFHFYLSIYRLFIKFVDKALQKNDTICWKDTDRIIGIS